MSSSIAITNFKDTNPAANAGPVIVVVGSVFLSMAILSVMLRVLSRLVLRTGVGLDDILSLATLFFVVISVGINLYGVNNNGWGLHTFTINSLAELHSFLLGLYVFEIAYTISTAMVRFSIMALYLRMFRKSVTFSRTLIVVVVLNSMWIGVVTLLGVFACNPVDGFWLFEKPSQCLDSATYFIGSASANIVLEVIVIIIPIPVVYNLRLPWNQRLAVSCVILFSIIIPVMAFFRLNELLLSAQYNAIHTDPTYSLVGSAIWSMIEICLGLIVSCLPCIRSLLRHTSKTDQVESIPSHRASKTTSSFPPSRRSYSIPFNLEPIVRVEGSLVSQYIPRGNIEITTEELQHKSRYRPLSGIQADMFNERN